MLANIRGCVPEERHHGLDLAQAELAEVSAGMAGMGLKSLLRGRVKRAAFSGFLREGLVLEEDGTVLVQVVLVLVLEAGAEAFELGRFVGAVDEGARERCLEIFHTGCLKIVIIEFLDGSFKASYQLTISVSKSNRSLD